MVAFPGLRRHYYRQGSSFGQLAAILTYVRRPCPTKPQDSSQKPAKKPAVDLYRLL
ncbi:hypothetical protein [Mesorhizobium australicum]|uniref:hypothetical protein n=1 Tax=Mesorhizobium australicum TaxID=536018 RepID=UPI00333821D6